MRNRGKPSARRPSLLLAYSETLGQMISRQRSERALAGAKIEADVANRAKSEFLASMSHELRTPLNAIIGFAEIMRDTVGRAKPEKQREYSEHILSAGQHLLSLVSDILDMAKIESGSVELDIQTYEIDELIDSCVVMLEPRIASKKQRIGVQIEKGLARLRCDGRRMKQVLLNLLSNAHKFTPEGGMLGVEAANARAGGIAIRVVDSGIGMSPDELLDAMQPFRQVSSALSRTHEGTGLGLPIAKRLVELHGATFRVESKKNVGTCVSLEFPYHLLEDDTFAAGPLGRIA
jgi:two-component system cell cycle sensor histidine kinase PleC